jgi:hypothetical protein
VISGRLKLTISNLKMDNVKAVLALGCISQLLHMHSMQQLLLSPLLRCQ